MLDSKCYYFCDYNNESLKKVWIKLFNDVEVTKMKNYIYSYVNDNHTEKKLIETVNKIHNCK